MEKCFYMQVGNRYNVPCNGFVSDYGRVLSSVEEIRYLGVFLCAGNRFSCSVSTAKKSFNRSANAIFSKVINSAATDVVLNLLKVKSVPILMYALEACSLFKHQLSSFDFTVIRLGMKLLCLLIEILLWVNWPSMVSNYQARFWQKRSKEFNCKFEASDNILCKAMIIKGSVVFA